MKQMLNDKLDIIKKEEAESMLYVPNGEVLAVASQAVSQVLYNAVQSGETKEHYDVSTQIEINRYPWKTQANRGSIGRLMVGPVIFGIYGSFGHIELQRSMETEIQGVIYVPKKALKALEFRLDDDVLYMDFFRQFFIDEGDTEELKAKMLRFKDQKTVIDESLRSVFPFLDKEYNWKLVTMPEEVFKAGKNSLDELVAEHTAAVKGFLNRLDDYIHGLRQTGSGIDHQFALSYFHGIASNIPLLNSG